MERSGKQFKKKKVESSGSKGIGLRRGVDHFLTVAIIGKEIAHKKKVEGNTELSGGPPGELGDND